MSGADLPEEEEPRVPAGTWGSEPEAEPGPAESVERLRAPRASDPPPRPEMRTPTDGTPRRRDATPRPTAVDQSEIRPRFLASELLRKRSESFEPIWPTAARVLGATLGAVAATLAFALLGGVPLALAAGGAAVVLVLVSLPPMPLGLRAAAMALFGGLVVVFAGLLVQDLPTLLELGGALACAAGAFLRARRFRSIGARMLLGIGATALVVAFLVPGGIHALTLASFDADALLGAVLALGRLVLVLLPLVTMVDRNASSGALAVANVFLLLPLAHAIALAIAGDLDMLLAALALPAAALGLAQAMPSAAAKVRAVREKKRA